MVEDRRRSAEDKLADIPGREIVPKQIKEFENLVIDYITALRVRYEPYTKIKEKQKFIEERMLKYDLARIEM